jgi:hypothetical protein
MNKIRILQALLLLIIVCGCGDIREKKEPEEKIIGESQYLDEQAKPVIDAFFAGVKSGNYTKALYNLLTQNENIDMQDSLTIRLENKFVLMNEASGDFISGKLVRKKALADDLGIYIYLAKYEKKFYRFSFSFYNNGSSVKIFKFAFDDSIDIELEEGMKLYIYD